MKKVLLRALTLVAVIGGMESAFAQGASVLKNGDTPKFDPILQVRNRVSLFDGTRKSNFDSFYSDVRLGSRFTQSIITAVGEIEFYGNNLGSTPAGYNSNPTTAGQGAAVRQAYVGLTAYQSEPSTVSVMVGRYIPNGAIAYGSDALTGFFGLSGFLPEDGALVQYNGNFKSVNLTAQAGVASALPIWVFTNGVTATDPTVFAFSTSGASAILSGGSSFGDKSNTGNKAYLANVSAVIDEGSGKVEAVVAYGRQLNDVASTSATVTTPTACTTVGATTTCTGLTSVTSASTARDLNYIEASVGYNIQDELKYGLWYSYADLGETKTSADNNAGAQTFGNGDGIKDQYSMAGIGIQANSKYIGMTNLLQKDDAITVAAGVQMFMHRQTGSSAASALNDSTAAKSDVTQINVGTGYVKGAFSTEINYSRFLASSNVFLNQGQNNYTNSTDLVYLTAAFSL